MRQNWNLLDDAIKARYCDRVKLISRVDPFHLESTVALVHSVKYPKEINNRTCHPPFLTFTKYHSNTSSFAWLYTNHSPQQNLCVKCHSNCRLKTEICPTVKASCDIVPQVKIVYLIYPINLEVNEINTNRPRQNSSHFSRLVILPRVQELQATVWISL